MSFKAISESKSVFNAETTIAFLSLLPRSKRTGKLPMKKTYIVTLTNKGKIYNMFVLFR